MRDAVPASGTSTPQAVQRRVQQEASIWATLRARGVPEPVVLYLQDQLGERDLYAARLGGYHATVRQALASVTLAGQELQRTLADNEELRDVVAAIAEEDTRDARRLRALAREALAKLPPQLRRSDRARRGLERRDHSAG